MMQFKHCEDGVREFTSGPTHNTASHEYQSLGTVMPYTSGTDIMIWKKMMASCAPMRNREESERSRDRVCGLC
jgi:hypothetical protein